MIHEGNLEIRNIGKHPRQDLLFPYISDTEGIRWFFLDEIIRILERNFTWDTFPDCLELESVDLNYKSVKVTTAVSGLRGEIVEMSENLDMIDEASLYNLISN